ncbi:MAG: branched-chain amino acid ABC transporter permease [Deltaproteobacteria bacterium]|nr:branched-chain amino acid ABC transporter permease [Candidatus Deferrimicrobiaceae bacterium]
MDINLVFTQLIGGLTSSMTLFLVASGLTLIFGVVNVFNFAHGSFYLLGAYFAYQLVSVTGIGFFEGVLLASLCTGGAGAVMEFFFLRRIYGRGGEEGFQILLTYSFILIIDDVVKMIWGTDYKSITRPEVLDGSWTIGDLFLPRYDALVIATGLLVALGMWGLIRKSRFGRNLRAISANREMASSLGVNVPVTLSVVFGLATALGGLSGALSAPVRTVTPGAGVEVIIGSMIVVVIGGLGNFWGALVGALIIGEVTAFGILFLPQWAILFSYAVMALVLVFRPQGLFMKHEAAR